MQGINVCSHEKPVRAGGEPTRKGKKKQNKERCGFSLIPRGRGKGGGVVEAKWFWKINCTTEAAKSLGKITSPFYPQPVAYWPRKRYKLLPGPFRRRQLQWPWAPRQERMSGEWLAAAPQGRAVSTGKQGKHPPPPGHTSLVYIQIYANKNSAVNRVNGITNEIIKEEVYLSSLQILKFFSLLNCSRFL